MMQLRIVVVTRFSCYFAANTNCFLTVWFNEEY